MNAWRHFKTINKHRFLVMKHCFAVGLYWQGLTHDLSKYSWAEFRTGIQYYQGDRSPNAAERQEKGYSEAWMHHKGRNRHHYEYWSDIDPKTKQYAPVPMPTQFFVEMVMDRIAACKTYHGTAYQDGDALKYYLTAHETPLMHPVTSAKLRYVLRMLELRGEKETFRFLREVVLKEQPFGEDVLPLESECGVK